MTLAASNYRRGFFDSFSRLYEPIPVRTEHAGLTCGWPASTISRSSPYSRRTSGRELRQIEGPILTASEETRNTQFNSNPQRVMWLKHAVSHPCPIGDKTEFVRPRFMQHVADHRPQLQFSLARSSDTSNSASPVFACGG